MNRTEIIYRNAMRLGCCSNFKGTENDEELIRLFVTKQGIEFCVKYNYPDLSTLRTFRGLQSARHGVFIDANIIRHNLPLVVLVGDTVAELVYTDPHKRHEVIIMHGAKAIIKASGYAVVFITNSGGEVEKYTFDNAKIL